VSPFRFGADVVTVQLRDFGVDEPGAVSGKRWVFLLLSPLTGVSRAWFFRRGFRGAGGRGRRYGAVFLPVSGGWWGCSRTGCGSPVPGPSRRVRGCWGAIRR